jgi:hypothetical protein
MTPQTVNVEELDAGRSDGNLDRIRATARHVIAAWMLTAALAWRSYSDRRQPDRPQPALWSCGKSFSSSITRSNGRRPPAEWRPRLTINRNMETKMSALPTLNFSSAQAAARSAMSAVRSRRMRPGILILAVALPLAVTACTGGAGLDIGPVDHSCHVNPERGNESGGSGCAGGGHGGHR